MASEDSNLKSIAEHFEERPDSWSEVNREHVLVDVIVISIGAILAGADGPTGMECLEVPLLGSTDITDAELEHLRTLTGLKILALDGTKITNAGAPKLKGLYNHLSINLSGPRMTEEGVRQISEHPLLKFIPAMAE